MTSSLHPLFAAIDQVKDKCDLRSSVIPKVGKHFSAQRSGIFFFDEFARIDPKLRKLLKLALSIEHNPIARYLTEHHAPVHEALVTSPKVWRMICPRPDHWHVMAGPIVVQGQLVGAVGCTREKLMPAFDSRDLADLSGICLHLSLWSSTLNASHQSPKTNSNTERLTARELQIIELVALGRTNAEIGRELWITENSVKQALKRMFRKLEVSSRTEMVTQISSR